MNGWATFWAVTLLAALVLFAVVAVAVTIGGVRDIKALFANIHEPDAGGESGAGTDLDSGPIPGPGTHPGPPREPRPDPESES